MLTVQKLQFELSYSFLKVLHHLGGLKLMGSETGEERNLKFGAILQFLNKARYQSRPLLQIERVPDASGSSPSHVWPKASAHSAHAVLCPAPFPSAESYFCEQLAARQDG